jgi:hypothetical protein
MSDGPYHVVAHQERTNSAAWWDLRGPEGFGLQLMHRDVADYIAAELNRLHAKLVTVRTLWAEYRALWAEYEKAIRYSANGVDTPVLPIKARLRRAIEELGSAEASDE